MPLLIAHGPCMKLKLFNPTFKARLSLASFSTHVPTSLPHIRQNNKTYWFGSLLLWANISTVVYVHSVFFMYLSPFVNVNIISSLKPHSYFLTSLDEDNQSFYEVPWRNTILGI